MDEKNIGVISVLLVVFATMVLTLLILRLIHYSPKTFFKRLSLKLLLRTLFQNPSRFVVKRFSR